MTDLRAAADEARKLVKMFKSVNTIAETFDSIADIERLTGEVQARLDKANELETIEISKRNKIASEAVALVEEANAKAASIMEAAAKSVEKAQAELESTKKEHQELCEDMQHFKQSLETSKKERLAMLRELDDKIAARNKDLFDLEGKILRLKEDTRKSLGI